MHIVDARNLSAHGRHQIIQWAQSAFYGNPSLGREACDPENVSRACFLTERCANKNGWSHIPNASDVSDQFSTNFLGHGTFYTALNAQRVIMGVLCVHLDAHLTTPAYLYSFCVGAAYRRSSVGSALMARVISDHGHRPLKLTVAAPKRIHKNTNREIHDKLTTQHDRLVSYYKKFDFEKHTTRNGETPMTRKPALPSIYSFNIQAA